MLIPLLVKNINNVNRLKGVVDDGYIMAHE